MTPYAGSEPTPTLAVSPSLRTAAGSPLPVEVTVTNTATAPRVLTVGALGVEAAWLPPQVRTPVLAPGQSAVVTLTLAPSIGTVPAQYPLAFTAQATDPDTGRPTGTSAAMVDSVLVVNPRNQLSVTLEPRNASLISTKKVRLTLTNGGEQPARVEIGVQSSPKLLVRFRERAVDVLPGATREVRGRVRVPRGHLIGGRSQHSYTVSTRGTESVRHVEGSVTQRALISTTILKVLAVLAVLSIWIAAAVVFVPQLADRLGNDQSTTTTTTTTTEDGGSDGGSGGGEGSGSGDGSGSGQGDGKDGKGGKGGAKPAADKKDDEVVLSGTVAGEQPGGVTVSLEPTSLVDEDAQRGVGVGVPSPALGDTGMSLASSFLNRAVAQTPPDRTARSAPDGTWAFTGVRTPGYYLLTFSKPGYQSQSFVVDSSSDAAVKPLKVDLTAGEGKLSGTVTGPRGPVGAATVTITDGTNTITTSSNSRGRVGHWSVSGMSTPGTYVVQAAKPGLSSESRMVALGAGGEAVADLQLRHGVGTLIGKARAVNESGELAGVGGAQVTVTSEDGQVRTATTLTQGERARGSRARAVADFVGTYTVPGLPVPGDYVVTISGAGLQTQTSKISFGRGQSQASVSADLVSASGSIAGTITGLANSGAVSGLVGVGLTLSNADNTYKTMSTSDPAGGYLVNGVVPGTYTLRSEFFGYQTDDVTVTVRAGRTVALNRRLVQIEGGVLAARSSVRGRVIDGAAALPVTCPGGPGEECLIASVLEPGIEDDTSDDRVYDTTFLASDEFTLPDPLQDPDGGLLPGLHTVTVSAPHYASAVVRVQVAPDSTTDLGTLEMLPAPKIVGLVSAAIGAPSGDTCVWAMPAGGGTPPAGCDTGTGGAAAECQATTATFAVGDNGRVCAFVAGTGNYSIEVPKEGTWTLYLQPSDGEYLTPAAASILLESGVTRNQSFVLNRLGRMALTVVAPNASGVVSPLGGATVTLTPAAGTPDTPDGLTRSDGTVELRSVPPGTYTATATKGGTSGSRGDLTVGLNQLREVRITATHPIDDVIGQVTYNFDGSPEPVPGAAVQVIAPTGYNDDGTPIQGSVGMTTDSHGCFIVEKSGSTWPAVAGIDDCAWPLATGPVPSRGKQTFVSNVTDRVTVSATGFAPLVVGDQTLSTEHLNEYTLDPLPVPLGTVRPTTDPPAPAFDWGQVTFTVQPLSGPADSILVTGAGFGSNGRLTWFDSRIRLTDRVLAGTYVITGHRAGYLDGQATLVCRPPGPCVWKDDVALQLTELASLAVTAKDGASTVPEAIYTLLRDGGSPQTLTAGAGGVTFTGLDPTETDYTVQVRAAGYDFGVDVPLDLTCGVQTEIVLAAGQQTTCTVAMRKLGTVIGTITGAPAKPPGTAPVTTLANATVTVRECTETDDDDKCVEVDDTPTFTGTTLGDGTFRITGTTDDQGLDLDKDWLVQASAPGYSMADPGAGIEPGALVTSFTSGSATANLQLVLTPVDVSVVLLEGGTTPFTGATVELRRHIIGGTELVQTAVLSGTSYLFDDVTPGSYVVLASGGGLLTATQTALIVDQDQVITMPVVRAANTVQGTITASDPIGPLVGATVTVCDTEECTEPVTGTDRNPATFTTGPSGFYLMRTVPDGNLWVKVSMLGYQSQVLGPYQFDHLLAPLPPIDARLDPVVRQVTITVKRTWSNNDLSTAALTLRDAGGSALAPVPLTPSGGDYAATFNQVKWGCWTVELDLPEHHYGSPSSLQDRPTDPHIPGCTAADEIKVPSTDDDEPATASMGLDEGRVDVTVTATARADFGHAAPGTVRLQVTNGADTIHTETAFPLGTRTLWLPSGGGYEVSAQRLPADDFWPIATDDTVTVPLTKPAGADAVLVPLAITELAATWTVTILGTPAEATLTLTPPSDESVPAAYLPSVLAEDGTFSFELPRGSWTVTAVTADDSDSRTQAISEPREYTSNITLDPPPEEPDD